ncbi:MAG: type II secretion system F family protein [Opitutales bacterium]|nr:type II secretion system F family protein [Opitutales bacterium]
MFICQVVDSEGRNRWLFMRYASKWECLRALWARGFLVQRVLYGKRFWSAHAAIQLSEWESFWGQLQSSLSVGNPLTTALETIQVRNTTLRGFVSQALSELKQGRLFSSVLFQPKFKVPVEWVLILQQAEMGGFLPKGIACIERLVRFQTRLVYEIKRQLIYPLFVAGVAVGFMGGAYGLFLPRIADFYAQQGQSVDKLTAFVLSIPSSWVYLLIATFGILLTVLWRHADRLVLAFQMRSSLIYSWFAMVLGMLLQNGLPLLESVQVAWGCLLKRYSLQKAQQCLLQGNSLSVVLSDFPSFFCQSLQKGESYGRLAQTLMDLSEQYYNQYEKRLLQQTKWIEPISIVALSLVIFAIIWLIGNPLFQLIKTIDLSF